MSSVESWSTTAASNNSAPPDGFPENQTPASLNDCARTLMASLATLVRQLPWIKLSTGLTLVRNSATQFQLTGIDVTTTYTVGRRLREVGATTVYGSVSASTFSGGNTLVDVLNDAAAAIPTSLTAVDVSALDTNALLNAPAIASTILGLATVEIPVGFISPSTTAGCASLVTLEGSAGDATKPDYDVLDFDGTTAEHAKFSFRMPDRWNLGTLTASFQYVVNAAVNTTVTWQLAAVAASDGDALTSAYGTAQAVTDTYLNTANLLAVTSFTSAITVAGTPAKGDRVFFRLSRDPSVDTTSQDARLAGVTIKYTTNALNDN